MSVLPVLISVMKGPKEQEKTVDNIHDGLPRSMGALTRGPRHERRGGGTKGMEEWPFVLGIMHTQPPCRLPDDPLK